MQRYFLLYIILSSGSGLFGQERYTVKTFPLSFIDRNEVLKYNDILVNGEEFTGYYKLGSEIYLDFFSLQKRITKTKLDLPKKDKKLVADHSIKMSRAGDTLLLSLKNIFFRIKIKKNYATEIISRTELKKNYGIDHFYKNGTFFSYEVRNTPVEEDRAWVIEKKANSIDEKKTRLAFDYAAFASLGPNNFIDFCMNGFVVANAASYKVYIYDHDHKKVDSIVLNDSSLFKPLNEALLLKVREIESDAYNIKEHLPFLQELRQKGSQVWSINYITRNIIAVRFSSPVKNGESFDMIDHVWRKDNGKWEIVLEKKISRYFEKLNEHMSESDIWPYYLYGSRTLYEDGKIYFFYWSNNFSNIADKPICKAYYDSNVSPEKLVLKLSVLDFNK
jgi:hypothetical protein